MGFNGDRELKKYMETQSEATLKEKEVIRKIELLKNSKQYIEEIEKLDEEIKTKKKQKFEAGAGLADLKETIANLKAEVLLYD